MNYKSNRKPCTALCGRKGESTMPCTEAYKEHIMYMFNSFCKTVIRFAILNAWRNRSRWRQKKYPFYGFPSTFFHTTSLRLFSKVYTYLFYLKRYFIIADFLCHHHSLYPDQRVIPYKPGHARVSLSRSLPDSLSLP